MVVLLALLLLGVVSTLLVVKTEKESTPRGLGIVGIVAFATLLPFMLISLPIERADSRSRIGQYHAFVRTIELARAEGRATEVERAAIQKDIASWNQRLAAARYWNGTIFDWFIVDEYANLPEIN